MDEDLQRRIQEAKAAGYSDEEISKVLGAAVPSEVSQPTEVPALSEEQKAQFQQADQQVADRNTGENITTGATAFGLGAAAGVAPYLLYKGAKAIGNRGGSPGPVEPTPMPKGSPIGNPIDTPPNSNATRTRVPINQPGVIEVPPNTGGQPRSTTRLPSGTMPAQGPVNPNAMPPRPTVGGPAAAEGANFIENISKKYLPAAGRVAGAVLNNPVVRAATGPFVAGMTYSPDTGPAVPSVGRLRGSEINPLTRAPWTPNEIAQYEKNYQMFDQQLPAPQMQR